LGFKVTAKSVLKKAEEIQTTIIIKTRPRFLKNISNHTLLFTGRVCVRHAKRYLKRTHQKKDIFIVRRNAGRTTERNFISHAGVAEKVFGESQKVYIVHQNAFSMNKQ
jgi:hypothetical protein